MQRTIWPVVLFALLTIAQRPALAQIPLLPGEPCNVPARAIWTEPEKWVWSRICIGREADFNKLKGYLHPDRKEGWRKDRALSSEFLETILLYEPYRSAITRKGVRIVGAWFPGKVDLRKAEIRSDMWLNNSRFEDDVLLNGFRSGFGLALRKSMLAGELRLIGADIRDKLDLSQAKISKRIRMAGFRLGRSVALTDGTFDVIV